MIKNPKDFLVALARYPAAVEAKLPEGVPRISATLDDITSKIPVLPDLPVELPDLPTAPELPLLPGGPEGLRRYITGVEVRATPTPTPTPPTASPRLGQEILS